MKSPRERVRVAEEERVGVAKEEKRIQVQLLTLVITNQIQDSAAKEREKQ